MTPQQQDWILVFIGLASAAMFFTHAWPGFPLDQDPPRVYSNSETAKWNAWIKHCVKTDPVCRQNLEDLR